MSEVESFFLNLFAKFYELHEEQFHTIKFTNTRELIISLLKQTYNTEYGAIDNTRDNKNKYFTVRYYRMTKEEYETRMKLGFLFTVFFGDIKNDQYIEGFCYDYRVLLHEGLLPMQSGSEKYLPIPLSARRWNKIGQILTAMPDGKQKLASITCCAGYLFYPLSQKEVEFIFENTTQKHYPLICSSQSGCWTGTIESLEHHNNMVKELFDQDPNKRYAHPVMDYFPAKKIALSVSQKKALLNTPKPSLDQQTSNGQNLQIAIVPLVNIEPVILQSQQPKTVQVEIPVAIQESESHHHHNDNAEYSATQAHLNKSQHDQQVEIIDAEDIELETREKEKLKLKEKLTEEQKLENNIEMIQNHKNTTIYPDGRIVLSQDEILVHSQDKAKNKHKESYSEEISHEKDASVHLDELEATLVQDSETNESLDVSTEEVSVPKPNSKQRVKSMPEEMPKAPVYTVINTTPYEEITEEMPKKQPVYETINTTPYASTEEITQEMPKKDPVYGNTNPYESTPATQPATGTGSGAGGGDSIRFNSQEIPFIKSSTEPVSQKNIMSRIQKELQSIGAWNQNIEKYINQPQISSKIQIFMKKGYSEVKIVSIILDGIIESILKSK